MLVDCSVSTGTPENIVSWYGPLTSMLSPVVEQDLMTMDNLLLILGILTNPGNSYKLWERSKTEKELGKPRDYPNWL